MFIFFLLIRTAFSTFLKESEAEKETTLNQPTKSYKKLEMRHKRRDYHPYNVSTIDEDDIPLAQRCADAVRRLKTIGST